MAERIRTTISLDPAVHEIFVRMAESAGQSVSRCMGDWLADTADGAQFVAMKMAEARKAPKTVMREMQAMVHGLSGELDHAMVQMRARNPGTVGGAKAEPRRADGVRVIPPSSNTGGKVPQKGPRVRGAAK